MVIGDAVFTATFADTQAAREFAQMLPVTITLDDYSGFEKVGSLGKTLTTSNSQITTQPGDIILYSGNQIVLFYGSNSWSYTRLASIDDLTGWAHAIGRGIDSVSVTFRLSTQSGEGKQDPPAAPQSTTLVAYFSATGNTRPLAGYAADILDADLYEIVPQAPYTSDDLNYNNNSSRANREQNDPTARPAIDGGVDGMEN